MFGVAVVAPEHVRMRADIDLEAATDRALAYTEVKRSTIDLVC